MKLISNLFTLAKTKPSVLVVWAIKKKKQGDSKLISGGNKYSPFDRINKHLRLCKHLSEASKAITAQFYLASPTKIRFRGIRSLYGTITGNPGVVF